MGFLLYALLTLISILLMMILLVIVFSLVGYAPIETEANIIIRNTTG